MTSVSFFVGVSNLGAPSITKNWALKIVTPKGTIIEGIGPIHVEEGFQLHRNDKPGLEFNGSDAIYIKTAETPIVKGSQINGSIVFFLQSPSWRCHE